MAQTLRTAHPRPATELDSRQSGRVSDMPRRVRLSLVGLVLAMPGLTYWIVGDLSEAGDDFSVDRVWSEPVSEGVAAVIGVASLLAAVTSLFVLLMFKVLPAPRAQAWSLGLLIAAGIILGAGLRVMTAGVSGANIGAGLYMLAGFPLCILLVTAAFVIVLRTRRNV